MVLYGFWVSLIEVLCSARRKHALSARDCCPCVGETHSRVVILDVDYDARGPCPARILLYQPVEGNHSPARVAGTSTPARFTARGDLDHANVELASYFSVL